MERNSPCLSHFRRTTWLRDLTVAALAGLTMLMPAYAGIPEWWISRGVIKPGVAPENTAALNAGQFKHAVKHAVAEMNEHLASEGGAGLELNALVAAWEAQGATPANYEMVNVGQVKAVLKLWYDRLNEVHDTTGYPWTIGSGPINYEAVNIGQLKKLLQIDVRLPWDQNIAQNLGEMAEETLLPPAGDLSNLHAVLGASDHYLRNPLLGLSARGGSVVALPANIDKLPSIPIATSAGEFKVGPDGAAQYTIRLQGPKGVANVEPALSLEYNSNGGDGILGQAWSLAGLSVINRGPTSIEFDGSYDPVDFDANDRFYLNGERLICVSGIYGKDGSEYRTLKEQFSKIVFHDNEDVITEEEEHEVWFEVFTKAGLVMEFGHCETSVIGPQNQAGQVDKSKAMTWAVCKVRDSLGNYWQVQYADSGPGADVDEPTPYLPDYQPSLIRYTGKEGEREPAHEIRFIYELRPDLHRGYLMGNLVRKSQRLCGIEMSTLGRPVRSWRLRYNIGLVNFTSHPASRSCLVLVQEVAGAYADQSASVLPATEFTWDEGARTWAGNVESDSEQMVTFPEGAPPYNETEFLTLEHTLGSNENWMSKSAQYVDLDGDGVNEILFNQRGPFLALGDDIMRICDYRQVMKPSKTTPNQWDVFYLPGVESGTPRQYATNSNGNTGNYQQPPGVSFLSKPRRRTEFPYLTTAASVPTGATLVDINGDGLPDIVSSGTFDYIALKRETGELRNEGIGEIINASGVWINQGKAAFEKDEHGNYPTPLFVKDVDSINDTSVRRDVYAGAPLISKDNWGAWRFPAVPNELNASAGGAVIARASTAITSSYVLTQLRAMGVLNDAEAEVSSFTIPLAAHSGDNEVLGYPQFALYNEDDLGWRFVDMDGDGDMDIIRAGQGYEPSGWMGGANPTPIGTGNLSPKGRQLCFGLRNNGPEAPAGERWTLINPQGEALSDGTPSETHLKSIWKLPLPLVDDNGEARMGRRLIDLNGDGLPDFMAQKKRATADPKAPWTYGDYDAFDMVVWINGGDAGWIEADQWTLEGLMIANLTSTGGYELDYGRMLQDMNGDGLPDFVVSSHIVTDDSNQLHQGVFLNTGNGWVKKLDTSSGRWLPFNFTSLIPPQELFYNRVPRPYSLIDMNGDGRPEFLNGRLADAMTPVGSSNKLSRTQFMSAFGGWIESPHLTADQDWNLTEELLAGTVVPLHFTELNGDGMMDLLRTTRASTTAKTYFRPSLYKKARIARIVNGLRVPMDITYGCLPQLSGHKEDAHYRPGPTATDSFISTITPMATVVTAYTTLDGTENTVGNHNDLVTTSYYYSGYRSHAIRGSLGFASIETRSTHSVIRQVTEFSQEKDTVGMTTSGYSYYLNAGSSVVLSRNATTYVTRDMDAALEVPGKHSRFTFASSVENENWSPEGVNLGKTTSLNDYGVSGSGKGMLISQTVRQDPNTPTNTADDVSTTTANEYHPRSTGSGQWRIGQIKKTTVTSSAPDTDPVQKVSLFEYYSSGVQEGLLYSEITDPGTDITVTKLHIYDDSGNEVKTLTSTTGLPTLVSETWYDASGRFPVASVNAMGHATVHSYDHERSLLTASTMAFQADAPSTTESHNPTAPTAPSGILSNSTTYDAWGTAKVTTGGDGLRSCRLAQYFVNSALPRSLYYVYEQAEGSPPVITYYDRYHRPLLVEKTGFNGGTLFQETQYDAKGRAFRVSKPYMAGAENPAYTIELYDDFDRKVKVIAPDGSLVNIAYNGFTSTITNHRGQQQIRVADMQERVIQSTDTDSNTVTFAYTADGLPRLSTVTYSGGSASTSIVTNYNAQRLKSSVIDPNTGTSSTEYDAYGRVIATSNSLGHSTAMEYDLLGRVTRSWTNYVAGSPATYETLTETVYDTASGMGIGKPHTITFTHVDGVATRSVSQTFTYDMLGRSIANSMTLTGQVAFNGTYSTSTTYYPSSSPGYGRTATITDPNGFTRASKYNNLGFLESVHEGSSSGTTLWQGLAYDAEGRTLSEKHGNGLRTENRFHPTRGFVESSRIIRDSTQAVVQNLQLRVNDLGNVEWRKLSRYEDAAGVPQSSPQTLTESFAFDSQNRLTSSYVVGQTIQSFTYEANGNIASKTGVGSYTYGAAGAGPHALTGVSTGSQSRRYSYDAKGRMLLEHIEHSGGTDKLLRDISYTSFDQPKFIQHWGSAPLSSDLAALDDGSTFWDQYCTINYYFGIGLQRIIQTKIKGRLHAKSLTLGGYELKETRLDDFATGDLVEKEERNNFGNGTRVKRWTAASPTVPLTVYEYGATDHLGSDSATYNGDGDLQMQRGHLKSGETQKSERQSYDAWGARRDAETWSPTEGQLNEAGSTPAPERAGSNIARGFTGHEMLDDVGLVHMNGRLYDPILGRMCAADPYVQTPENIQNYNRYSYVLNNPLSQIDPSGHFIIGLIAAIVGAIIGLIGAVIATVAMFVAYLAALAAQFVVTVVSAVGQAFGAIGNGLITAAKSGIALVSGSSAAGGAAGAAGGGLSFSKVLLGAAFGAVQGAVQAAVNGGSTSDILKAAAQGAIIGAISGVANGIVDSVATGITGLNDSLVHQLGHASVAGGMQEAQGGSFKDGFIGGLIGAGVASGMQSMVPGISSLPPIGQHLVNTSIAVVSGGVASMATGGKFGAGAWSGAFTYAMSAVAAGLTKPLDKPEYDPKFADEMWVNAYNLDENFVKGGAILDFMPAYKAANGFAAYGKYHDNGTLYIGYRGTEPFTVSDWVANVKQALGFRSYQYDQAVKIAELAHKHTNGKVIFVGHSLGGGLASAAAYRVGGNAVTYNAAGLSSRYKTNLTPKIHAVFIGGEILSTLQDFTFLPKAAGYRNAYVSKRWWRDPGSLHLTSHSPFRP